jgi:hypothetical protein
MRFKPAPIRGPQFVQHKTGNVYNRDSAELDTVSADEIW